MNKPLNKPLNEPLNEPMSARPVRPVTDRERADYARDGVVVLKQIYPAAWVAFLEAQLTDVFDNFADRAVDADSFVGTSGQGIRADMTAVAEMARAALPDADIAAEGERDAEYTGRSIVETDAGGWHEGVRLHHLGSPLPEIVAQVTESQKVNFYSDQLFLKEPGSMVKTPFHQDKPYFLVGGADMAVCWVPVDEVTIENGAMGYVRGSHLWGRTFKPSDFVTDTGTFPEVEGVDLAGLEELGPITADTHDLVFFDARPGDVIVHHWATVHGSAGNVSATRRRRAASVRYAPEGCVFYRRPSSPEPFRNTLDLVDGDALELSDRFPVVWPRPWPSGRAPRPS